MIVLGAPFHLQNAADLLHADLAPAVAQQRPGHHGGAAAGAAANGLPSASLPLPHVQVGVIHHLGKGDVGFIGEQLGVALNGGAVYLHRQILGAGDKHDTVGIDCVAMCVNDRACAGGEPLFFLDYIACGKNYPEKIAEIVKGVAEGCVQSGAALIGGETAEMPGFYPVDEYDLAGFAVGVVDKKDLITGEAVTPGDVLIGMASSGVHSNGFSLVRKVFEMTRESLDTYYEELDTTLGEALLAPTKIYVKALKSIKDAGVSIHGCSHITGGGFYENIPRMLKEGTRAVIKKDSYPVLPIFRLLAKKGGIQEQMMYNTYNMGLGMVLAVDPADAEKVMEAVRDAGETPYLVGKIEAGEKGVTLC